MIRVSIVEDDPGVRGELAARLARAEELVIHGVFASAEEAARGLAQARPDVVLVDIQLPGKSGIDLIREWHPRLPDARFMVLTTFDDDDLVFSALQAGAMGYLLKRSLPGELANAIRELQSGGSPMSSGISRLLVKLVQQGSPAPSIGLAPREQELLDHLACGRSYKECADRMRCSLDTVRTHIRRLYEKLHVHSRHEAIAKTTGPAGSSSKRAIPLSR
ncbi:MAG TPA: response regulator transcription factor [Verrucomicrobiota bacterium]|nr:DNA-binding response regulator [Verrucomicrobiales bacterium]HRI16487.1 response regulator transcription factor [Verrucomicrobiota bacterium]